MEKGYGKDWTVFLLFCTLGFSFDLYRSPSSYWNYSLMNTASHSINRVMTEAAMLSSIWLYPWPVYGTTGGYSIWPKNVASLILHATGHNSSRDAVIWPKMCQSEILDLKLRDLSLSFSMSCDSKIYQVTWEAKGGHPHGREWSSLTQAGKEGGHTDRIYILGYSLARVWLLYCSWILWDKPIRFPYKLCLSPLSFFMASLWHN